MAVNATQAGLGAPETAADLVDSPTVIATVTENRPKNAQ